MDEKYQKLCILQMQIGRMRRRIMSGRVQGLGIHPSQHMLLVHLMHMGRRPSQAKLAEEMNVSAALVARTLKNMEAGGYIERKDSSTDGRRNEITITARGEEVLREGRRMVQDVDARSFEGFSDAELEQLGSLLQKMHDNVSRLEQAEKEMRQN